MVLTYRFTLTEEANQTVSLYTPLDECTYAYSFQSLLFLYTAEKEVCVCFFAAAVRRSGRHSCTASCVCE
jgi:hypothetical protein